MLIVASKPGRMGNRLRVGAMMVAFSAEYGVTVANLGFDEYAEFFEGPSRDILCRYPAVTSSLADQPRLRHALFTMAFCAAAGFARVDRRWRVAPVIRLDWHELCDMSDAAFLRLARGRRVVILQGWHYVDHQALQVHADAVRRYFAPLPIHNRRAKRVLADARLVADVVVGVHIRRGDYRRAHGGRFFYSLADYHLALDRIARLLGTRVSFVVCSDEPWDPHATRRHQIYGGPGHPVEDLYTLAGCDLLIGPPSTYSAWASFYGGTPVYYGPPEAAFTLDDFSVVTNLWPPTAEAHLRYERRGARVTPWRAPEFVHFG